METNLIGRINALRQMNVADLRAEWLKLYGEPSRSRNRDFLWKRLAWRLQELQHGGLSETAKHRVDELAADSFTRARTPSRAFAETDPGPRVAPQHAVRDPRLPTPGTVISKQYKGRELRVTVREDGLELDGTMYGSATALAKAVTGSTSINGWLFLGVAKRKRKA